MSDRPIPILHTVKLKELRPTQMTVGLHEVGLKRKLMHNMTSEDAGNFMGKHFLPAILGPKQRHYIIDHHHLGRALLDEGIEDVYVNRVADLSHLDKAHFFTVMDNYSWLHPFDALGKRRSYDALPKTLGKLVDDPYRSLAGEVRRRGGYAKNTTPFSEFLWADFFRCKIERALLNDDFDKAASAAFALARKKPASYLPGWSGPDS